MERADRVGCYGDLARKGTVTMHAMFGSVLLGFCAVHRNIALIEYSSLLGWRPSLLGWRPLLVGY